MAKLLQISILLLVVITVVNGAVSTTRNKLTKSTTTPALRTTRTTRPTTSPTKSPKTTKTTKRTSPTTKRSSITRATITQPFVYKKYYYLNSNDCGTQHYLSNYDTVQVNAWQSPVHISPRSSCKVTFILNSNNYHLEAKYNSIYNYINSPGVSLNVYGGYSRDLIIYANSVRQTTYSGGQYQRIEVDLDNIYRSTDFDFSIIISARLDNSASVWWLGVLIPVIFIAIVASSIGCCIRRRRVLRYQRMNNPTTVTTATATYPTGTAAYPNTAPYPSTYQPPPAYPSQPAYGANQPIKTQPPAGYGATS